jgi:hypothetical protein
LTVEEREALQGLARRPETAQALAVRARIVLACAESPSNSEVSRRLGVSLPTVGKWRKRFVIDRLDGLRDEPRLGAPRMITDVQVEAVITKTLEERSARWLSACRRGSARPKRCANRASKSSRPARHPTTHRPTQVRQSGRSGIDHNRQTVRSPNRPTDSIDIGSYTTGADPTRIMPMSYRNFRLRSCGWSIS